MRLSELPAPSRLCPEGKAIWGPLTKILASRGYDNPVFAMVTEILAGAIVLDTKMFRELQEKGLDPYCEQAWREVREHLRDVARECCLTVADLQPLLRKYPSEHHKRAAELREELREIEVEISAAEPESDEWIEALERQRWNHFYLIGADLLARVHDDREAELRRMEADDIDGDEWKGAEQ